jgi:hypothetical protein
MELKQDQHLARRGAVRASSTGQTVARRLSLTALFILITGLKQRELIMSEDWTLVKRLRSEVFGGGALEFDAADAIEALQARIAELDALLVARGDKCVKLTQHLRQAVEQATQGVMVEHDCPAMYACAAILADDQDMKLAKV